MSAATTSTRTLVIALVANLGIAVSKFAAAAVTGSSAMLTEGVHSVVDSTNQLLLMWGRRAAKRPPDRFHPFGYGRELYFWSFVVAVLVFALGAGVSVYEGILHIAHPEPAVSPVIAAATNFDTAMPRFAASAMTSVRVLVVWALTLRFHHCASCAPRSGGSPVHPVGAWSIAS